MISKHQKIDIVSRRVAEIGSYDILQLPVNKGESNRKSFKLQQY